MNQNEKYQKISSLLGAIENCQKSGNLWWEQKHGKALDEFIENNMPSGSGFDSGTKLDDKSKPERIVFNTSFHHMDDSGGYCGWSEHQVIITPSLQFGFDVRVTGRDRNGIKDYMTEMFS